MLLDSLVVCHNGKRIDLYFCVIFSTGQIKLSPLNATSVPRRMSGFRELASNHRRSLFPRAVFPSTSASSSVPPLVASCPSRELAGDGLRMSVCQGFAGADLSLVVVTSAILIVASAE